MFVLPDQPSPAPPGGQIDGKQRAPCVSYVTYVVNRDERQHVCTFALCRHVGAHVPCLG